MMTVPTSSSSIPSSFRRTIMKHAVVSRSDSEKKPKQDHVFGYANKPLLPQQAQARLHQSPSFCKAVLSFQGSSDDLIERAIEFDYLMKPEKSFSTNNNCENSSSGPLHPQQAQQRLDKSPNFRKAVLDFRGQNSCLIERAIEMEYMTRLRNCMN